jgi:hypothetical protein
MNVNKLRSRKYLLAAAVAVGVCAFFVLTIQQLKKREARSARFSCVNNMKGIGLSFRQWALDFDDQYPFHVSTNLGGTLEMCAHGADGFDRNAVFHFLVLSNQLNSPKWLLCTEDRSRQAALHFSVLRPENISYRLYSGTNVSSEFPQAILAVCSVDGNTLLVDGSVFKPPPNR